MASIIYEKQSTKEIRTYDTDYTPSLPKGIEGVTVLSAIVVHTPPSGAPLTPSVSVISPHIYVTFGKPLAYGRHILSVIGVFSDTQEIEQIYMIDVR